MSTALLFLIGLATTARAGAPVFEDDPAVLTAEKNVFLKVRCSARGEPEPFYKWFNEAGDELGPYSHPPVQLENGRNGGIAFSDLVFNVTLDAHTGLYTCTAQNEHGLRSKLYNITIDDSPGDNWKENNDSLEIVNVTSTSVTFHIDLGESKKTLDITYMEKIQDIILYRSHAGEEIIVFKNLIPSGHYTFNFTLRQRQEPKMWKATVVLLPSVPEVIFRHLADGMLTIEWFRTFDDSRRATIDKYRLQYLSVRMFRGNDWERSPCNATIEIPACFGSSFTLANLQNKVYYEIDLSAHTSTGYGMPYKNKVYIP